VRGGVVEAVADDAHPTRRWNGYGNAVVVRHPRLGVWSFYAHLDSVEVEEGQVVEAGQRLGAVGNSTNRRFPYMVPHLHLEVRRAKANGESPFPGAYREYNLDPEPWLASLGVRYDHEDAAEDTAQPVLVVDSCEHGRDHVHAPTASN
jgi:murein DD-endopeptidase MepM/ murein hydrolase activator NlpD